MRSNEVFVLLGEGRVVGVVVVDGEVELLVCVLVLVERSAANGGGGGGDTNEAEEAADGRLPPLLWMSSVSSSPRLDPVFQKVPLENKNGQSKRWKLFALHFIFSSFSKKWSP